MLDIQNETVQPKWLLGLTDEKHVFNGEVCHQIRLCILIYVYIYYNMRVKTDTDQRYVHTLDNQNTDRGRFYWTWYLVVPVHVKPLRNQSRGNAIEENEVYLFTIFMLVHKS